MRPLNLVEEGECAKFREVFQDIVEILCDDPEFRNVPHEIKEVFRQSLVYHSKGGKNFRGNFTVASFKSCSLLPSEEDIYLSYVLGCVMELFQIYAIMLDDLIDGSEYRRGTLCWYRHPDVGNLATIDANLIFVGAHKVMDHFFRDKVYYSHLCQVTQEVVWITFLGQSLDTRIPLKYSIERKKVLAASLSTVHHSSDFGFGIKEERVYCSQWIFSSFNEKLYQSTIRSKTSIYSFYFPVVVAVIQAGLWTQDLDKELRHMTEEMGYYFSIQDDFLDVYGSKAVTGKDGTDIQDGKCTWLIVTALKWATPRQKMLLLENYGRKETESVAVVRQVYDEIDIMKLYDSCQDEGDQSIRKNIQSLQVPALQKVFGTLWDMLRRRNN